MSEAIDNQYAAEAAERWPEQFAESNRRFGALGADQQREVLAKHGDITARLGALFQAGETVESDAVQAVIQDHYRWITNFWTPNQAAYRGLGEMYASDERFAANYESVAVGLADFMRRAMSLYASANLG